MVNISSEMPAGSPISVPDIPRGVPRNQNGVLELEEFIDFVMYGKVAVAKISTENSAAFDAEPAAEEVAVAKTSPTESSAAFDAEAAEKVGPETRYGSWSHWKENTLEAHNIARRQHGVPALAWSDECYDLAKKQAQACQAAGQMLRGHCDGASGRHGQNLYWNPCQCPHPNVMVNCWFREAEQPGYDFAAATARPGTEQFSQVVWKATTQVAMALSEDEKFCVANYFPAGNVGNFKENVFPKGTAVPKPFLGALAAAKGAAATAEATFVTSPEGVETLKVRRFPHPTIDEILDSCPGSDFKEKIEEAFQQGADLVTIDRVRKPPRIHIRVIATKNSEIVTQHPEACWGHGLLQLRQSPRLTFQACKFGDLQYPRLAVTWQGQPDGPADAMKMPKKGKAKLTSVVPEPASIGKASPKADAASSDPKQAAWTEVTFGADVCEVVPWGGRVRAGEEECIKGLEEGSCSFADYLVTSAHLRKPVGVSKETKKDHQKGQGHSSDGDADEFAEFEHALFVGAETYEDFSALFVAVNCSKPRVAALLLQARADVHEGAYGSAITPLHGAWSADVAAMLLKARADPNRLDDQSMIPLHWAACSCSDYEVGVAKQLIKAKADVNLSVGDGCDFAKYRGKTPLSLAVDCGNPVALLVLEAGCNLDFKGICRLIRAEGPVAVECLEQIPKKALCDDPDLGLVSMSSAHTWEQLRVILCKGTEVTEEFLPYDFLFEGTEEYHNLHSQNLFPQREVQTRLKYLPGIFASDACKPELLESLANTTNDDVFYTQIVEALVQAAWMQTRFSTACEVFLSLLMVPLLCHVSFTLRHGQPQFADSGH
eukprot:s2865_g10.t1